MSAFPSTQSAAFTTAASDSTVIRRLTECRSEFLRFFRRRLSRPEDAEDAFQEFCLKVVRAAETPEAGGKIDAWLRRVLRNTLTDVYRRRAARQQAEAAYEAEPRETLIQADAGEPEKPCECVHDAVPMLRPDYAEIIRRADLDEEPRERIAADLGLTVNNIGVRLHRARRALKEKIEERCPMCCDGSFRSCDCRPAAHGAGRSDRPADACNAEMAGASV